MTKSGTQQQGAKVNKTNSKKKQNESNATFMSNMGDNSRFLKNPSLFTEGKSKPRIPLKGDQDSTRKLYNSQKRFDRFYNSQIQFMDNKNYSILKQLEKKDRDLRLMNKQRNMLTLISSGSKRILSRSKKRSVDPELVTFRVEPGNPRHSMKPSIDYRTNSTYDQNASGQSIHERLFMEKSLNDEKKRNLTEKYNKEQKLKCQSKSISSKDRSANKAEILKLCKSVQSLNSAAAAAGGKNMQQSSQAQNDGEKVSESIKIANITVKTTCDKLYNDALRRRGHMNLIDTNSKSRSKNKHGSKSRNRRSEMYLVQIFNSDFEKAVERRGIKIFKKLKALAKMDYKDKLLFPELKNHMLNYYHSSELLKDLGFMYTDEEHNDKADERMLFVDFWRLIKGEEKQKKNSNQSNLASQSDSDKVSLYNLKKVLLAIQGFLEMRKSKNSSTKINQHTRKSREYVGSHIERSHKRTIKDFKKSKIEETKQAVDQKQTELSDLVDFDLKNTLTIEDHNIIKLRKYFMTFARNRSDFVNKKITQKLSRRRTSTTYTHNPKINKKSRYIVQNLHSKLNEHKIPHYELLLYKGKEYEKKKEINIMNQNQKLPDSCTFEPVINKNNNLYKM